MWHSSIKLKLQAEVMAAGTEWTLESYNYFVSLPTPDRSYTSDLRSRGLVPISKENDAQGHAFTLKDLDGSEVTIWGE